MGGSFWSGRVRQLLNWTSKMERTDGSNLSIDVFPIFFNHCVLASLNTPVDIERTEPRSWQFNITQKCSKN